MKNIELTAQEQAVLIDILELELLTSTGTEAQILLDIVTKVKE